MPFGRLFGYMITTVKPKISRTPQPVSSGPTARRPRKRLAIAAAVLIGLGCCLTGADVRAQTPTGKQDYDHYCAVCHGSNGKGKGPGSYTLAQTNPSDLTRLSRRNNGKFPFRRVYNIVDGREQFPSHERLNMPFFGTNLEIEEGQSPQGKARVRSRIEAIVKYVESLQQK